MLDRSHVGEWLAHVETNASKPHFYELGFLSGALTAGDQDHHLHARGLLNNAQLESALFNGARIHFDGGILPEGLMGLDISCVRALEVEAQNPTCGPQWLVDLNKIPGSEAGGKLSLPAVYDYFARHFPLGLAAARSRNRLSFIPTKLSAAKPVTFRFLTGLATTSFEQILIAAEKEKENELKCTLGGAVTAKGGAPILVIKVADYQPNGSPAIFPSLGDAITQYQRQNAFFGVQLFNPKDGNDLNLIVSGVELKASKLTEAPQTRLVLSREPGRETYGQAPLGVDLDWNLETASIQPRSQEPEIGFETLSGWLHWERPFVIPLGDPTVGLRLQIMELANREQSRLLRLKLRVLDLFYRPSWWQLFRDATARTALTVTDGVRFELRATRQTADPFVLNSPAIDREKERRWNPPAGHLDWARPPLRGGVDWPFQSQTVYEEILSPKNRNKGEGSISNLVFGTLGGSGKQSAAFSNGKTLIISE